MACGRRGAEAARISGEVTERGDMKLKWVGRILADYFDRRAWHWPKLEELCITIHTMLRFEALFGRAHLV